MSEAGRKLYGNLPPGVVGEVTHFKSIFDQRQSPEEAERFDADYERSVLARRRDTKRVIPLRDVVRACDAARLNETLPPWIGWALQIVLRDLELQSKRVPIATRMRLIRLYRRELRIYKKEIASNKLKEKCELMVRLHEKRQQLEAIKRKDLESDYWPGFPRGGLRNRYDTRRR